MVSNCNGQTRQTKILLDTGSQRTYISKQLASDLELKSSQSQILSVFTFGNRTSTTIKTHIVDDGYQAS